MNKSNTSFFVGICNNDYEYILQEHLLKAAQTKPDSQEILDITSSIAYNTYAFASNRVSYYLGLLGTSLSVDTASSSSLVAVHLANQDVRQYNVRHPTGKPASEDLH